MSLLLWGLALAFPLTGCAGVGAALQPEDAPELEAEATPELEAEAPFTLPFLEGEIARAFEESAARGLPIFVDASAAWCHSCLSMQAEVFSDPLLAPLAGSFVWLRLDVDQEEVAGFLRQYPQVAYPTLWVIAPDGRPLLRWVGTMTAPQLHGLLGDVLKVQEQGAQSPLYAQLLEAEGLAAGGEDEAAAKIYRALLTEAPVGWEARGRAANALRGIYRAQDDFEACVALARGESPRLPVSALGLADLTMGGMHCGMRMRPLPVADLEALVARALALTEEGVLLADDRSTLFRVALMTKKRLEQPIETVLARWRALLEGPETDRGPAQRRIFDGDRVVAYRWAGQLALALPYLQQTTRDFPESPSAHARLAALWWELGDGEEALEANTRALAMAPPNAQVTGWLLASEIYREAGECDAAQDALSLALMTWEDLDDTQKPAAIADRLAAASAAYVEACGPEGMRRLPEEDDWDGAVWGDD